MARIAKIAKIAQRRWKYPSAALNGKCFFLFFQISAMSGAVFQLQRRSIKISLISGKV
ncbi:MAG TPA: hypothetical protein VHV32_12005 [Candidatus Angelobacter sp.]|jgi:hypothetical protein|nr:hypothetical protein [Candidatus Angelobacter sp.]